jgi:hypothetical protein
VIVQSWTEGFHDAVLTTERANGNSSSTVRSISRRLRSDGGVLLVYKYVLIVANDCVLKVSIEVLRRGYFL